MTGHFRIAVAHERYPAASKGLRIVQSAYTVGRAAAGRRRHHGVVRSEAPLFQIHARNFPMVFQRLLGMEHSIAAACHNAGDGILAAAIGRRAFRRVHISQPTAGTGAHIDHPPALLHSLRNQVHRLSNVPEHIRNTHSNGLILPVDAAKQFQRRPGGQAHALRISLLGGKCFQPGNGLLVRLHDYFPPAFMVSENRF